MKKVAVILAGCGAKDGSEIHESTLALYALAKNGFEYSIFAPNRQQYDVVNGITDELDKNPRNLMIEAARIARGNISSVSELNPECFDALVVPGGFGMAKNIFTLAYEGLDFTVDGEVEAIVKAFHSSGKPIGAMCISPVMIAKVLGASNVKVTLGADSELSEGLAAKTGAIVVSCDRDDVIVDVENKVVTTPAYMYGDSTIASIGKGAEKMILELNNLLTEK
ncbi:MAG: isoprenoid biosynthesis glyoxalase ElbB [Rikenellaceae bacterium]